MVEHNELARYIGMYIKREREEQTLTQQELSEITGISISHISSIERGIKLPGTVSLFNLINALHIDVVDLFEPYLNLVKTDPEQYEKFCGLGKNIDEEAMTHILYMLEKVQSK